MEKIRLRFTADSSLLSRLIRLFTWSSFSHVDFITSNGRVIGSWPDGGVQFFDYAADRVRYAEIEVNSSATVETFIKEQLNKPYDWSAIFGMLFRRDWHEEDSWFCSELIAEALKRDGIEVVRKDSNRITPQDLLESTSVKLL